MTWVRGRGRRRVHGIDNGTHTPPRKATRPTWCSAQQPLLCIQHSLFRTLTARSWQRDAWKSLPWRRHERAGHYPEQHITQAHIKSMLRSPPNGTKTQRRHTTFQWRRLHTLNRAATPRRHLQEHTAPIRPCPRFRAHNFGAAPGTPPQTLTPPIPPPHTQCTNRQPPYTHAHGTSPLSPLRTRPLAERWRSRRPVRPDEGPRAALMGVAILSGIAGCGDGATPLVLPPRCGRGPRRHVGRRLAKHAGAVLVCATPAALNTGRPTSLAHAGRSFDVEATKLPCGSNVLAPKRPPPKTSRLGWTPF